ncbi:bcl-2-related ovarian killer protein homolog A isoform X2 [Scleropages formosus]|uniref:bcl-2-related ovarian killer protein homolog A isoform X2 n=1 Tax=Scleropages formosus TaxID=113540 RepID=UPI00087897A2|nr:bcl-2-related ovarian killer protein isoform X2 [Scleropages formosus]
MEMLRRSSVFASEVMEVFDRSPTDKELVSQAKALCRDYIHSRLNRANIGWPKPDQNLSGSGGSLREVSSVLLWLGDELEYLRPSVYRNVARQLNITVASESVVSDAYLAVATEIFSTGGHHKVRGEHGPQFPLSLAGVGCLYLRTLPEGRRLLLAPGALSEGPGGCRTARLACLPRAGGADGSGELLLP